MVFNLKTNPAFDNRYGTDTKTEWLTPPEIIEACGNFDLDPCAPIFRPWDTAENHYSILDDGLEQKWKGRVFLNPPYTSKTYLWMEKLAKHKNGLALIFARTDTKSFFPYVWYLADGIFFFQDRIRFYNVDGTPADHTAGAPSVLVAYGKRNARLLNNFPLEGKFLALS